MSFVLLISFIVIFCRSEYIRIYILLVVVFVVSIIPIVLKSSLFRILLRWEGLGLISDWSVIYYQNVNFYNAGTLTVLRNRIGDVAILLRIAWIIDYGSWNFIFYTSVLLIDYRMIMITILVISSVFIKEHIFIFLYGFLLL